MIATPWELKHCTDFQLPYFPDPINPFGKAEIKNIGGKVGKHGRNHGIELYVEETEKERREKSKNSPEGGNQYKMWDYKHHGNCKIGVLSH